MSSLLPIRSEPTTGGQEPRVVDLEGEDAEAVFSALSSSTAREIVAELHDDPRAQSEIADDLDTTVQNVRYHLDKLEDAGLVEVVDTWYSSRGNEMKVYAPADGALIVSGDESKASRLRTALSRLVGGVAILGLASVLLQTLVDRFSPSGSQYSFSTQAPAGEAGGAGGAGGAPAPDGGDGALAGGGGDAGGGDGGVSGGAQAPTRADGVELSKGADNTTVVYSGDQGDGVVNGTPYETVATTSRQSATSTSVPEATETAAPKATETADATQTAVTRASETTADVARDAAQTTTTTTNVTPTPEDARQIAEAATSADPGGLPPGALFFLGGATVLVAFTALWYWSGR